MAKEQPYHHGDLRQGLLSAALKILETKDAKSISLREVARQAGVSHTAPYRHFEDKAALLAAVAEEGFAEFGQYLRAALVPTDPIESLQATGAAYVRYAQDHPTHFRVMFGCFPLNEPPDSSLEVVSKSTFRILVDVIESGQVAGVVKAGDSNFLALGQWAVVHGIAMLLLDGMLNSADMPNLVDGLIRSGITGILVSS
ncbi:MAG: TetR/AcrR family transcriptional regulator [Cyanobacteria bacterium P01_D01_bin.36]